MKFIELAIKESKKSIKSKDVPVGAVIVYNNKVIGKGHNNRMKKHLTIAHAEIIAINKANKKIGDWRLNNCIMYVTLEPCEMCKQVIRESRISKVYYLLENEKKVNDNLFEQIKNEESKEKYKLYFQNFFKYNCKR